MILRGYRVGPLLQSTGREILSDKVPSLAATTAYYFFFSLFPLLLFLTPLLSVVGDKQRTFDFIVGQLASVVQSPEALAPLREAMRGVVFSQNAPGLMSTGALLAAWSGSNIFGAMMDALNTAYDTTETRPWWKRQLLRLGVFLAAVVIVVLATAVMLAGDAIVSWLGAHLGIGGAWRTAWLVLQYPLAAALLVALAYVLFYYLPAVRQKRSHAVVAAVVTTVLWIAATLLFRLYVRNFASFNKTYGTIGGIIALLTWMYYTMFVVLSGGELASELHHGSGRVDPERGAVYHGRIVSGDHPATSSIARAEGRR